MTSFWTMTHLYRLLQQLMCTQWTPHRRCWTRRLPLHYKKKGRDQPDIFKNNYVGSWGLFCILTKWNPWNSCNSFDFITERVWECVHHERLQNIIKHTEVIKPVSKNTVCRLLWENQFKEMKMTRTSVMSTSSISLPLGTKALAKSLMAWIMLTNLKERDHQ